MLAEIPQGYQKYYPANALLQLQRALHGLAQAAMSFFREAAQALRHAGMHRDGADPCLYFVWGKGKLSAILLWAGDMLIAGPKKKVLEIKEKLVKLLECKGIGEMKEHAGCAAGRGKGWLKLEIGRAHV